MGEVLKFLQNNYRARLYRGYTVNAPWSFTGIWNIAKMFMEETTVMKISIKSQNTDPNMFTHINKSQVETTYGGTAEPVTSYW